MDRKVVRNNIKLAAKVITNLDKKWELWQKPQDTPQDADKAQASIDMGIISNNPILNNITDYLIEEASAEEEELLGIFFSWNQFHENFRENDFTKKFVFANHFHENIIIIMFELTQWAGN